MCNRQWQKIQGLQPGWWIQAVLHNINFFISKKFIFFSHFKISNLSNCKIINFPIVVVWKLKKMTESFLSLLLCIQKKIHGKYESWISNDISNQRREWKRQPFCLNINHYCVKEFLAWNILRSTRYKDQKIRVVCLI